jgi:hypothetical protein
MKIGIEGRNLRRLIEETESNLRDETIQHTVHVNQSSAAEIRIKALEDKLRELQACLAKPKMIPGPQKPDPKPRRMRKGPADTPPAVDKPATGTPVALLTTVATEPPKPTGARNPRYKCTACAMTMNIPISQNHKGVTTLRCTNPECGGIVEEIK